MMHTDGATEKTTVGHVTLDGEVTVLAQYDPSIRWNGWLCPLFDSLTAVTVLETINALNPTNPVYWYEFLDGVLHVRDRTDDMSDYIDTYEPDGDGLYPLGSHGWIWSASTDPDEERP